ncbi:hypothetical protein LSH36_462g02015 [Paralvinella palmiformis]|uniref:Uncharacterized protein n=1 Tax=Paralvinella palmiformis TaxID=53620 RepID=A0AAD9MYT5_9ANNE|nr:hypothetical protein LSH36_462g02015 [Paralvinella palmiformis]
MSELDTLKAPFSCDLYNDSDQSLNSSEVYQILSQELERIGQPTTVSDLDATVTNLDAASAYDGVLGSGLDSSVHGSRASLDASKVDVDIVDHVSSSSDMGYESTIASSIGDGNLIKMAATNGQTLAIYQLKFFWRRFSSMVDLNGVHILTYERPVKSVYELISVLPCDGINKNGCVNVSCGKSGRHHQAADHESSDANRGRHSESEEVSMISGNRLLNRIDISDQNLPSAVVVSQGSAFQVKQTRPPLIQPRPLQPNQVAPMTLTAAGMAAAGMAAVTAPQYQYQYPPGNMVQASGMIPVSGVSTAHGPVQMHYGPIVTQAQPQPHFSAVPQPVVSSYGGVEAVRPIDQVIRDDNFGRGRSHSFGGGRPSGLVSRGLQRGRHRSTQALSGRYDDERSSRERYDFSGSSFSERRNRSSELYDSPSLRYTDRVWESHAARDSPYDYRKRFEQIREERYGRDSKYRDVNQRQRDFSVSPEGHNRRLHHVRDHRDGQSQRNYYEDYLDYDDVQGYYSDPESPERYTRSRPRYNRHFDSRSPEYYRSDHYDGVDDYEYDTGPLDEEISDKFWHRCQRSLC